MSPNSVFDSIEERQGIKNFTHGGSSAMLDLVGRLSGTTVVRSYGCAIDEESSRQMASLEKQVREWKTKYEQAVQSSSLEILKTKFENLSRQWKEDTQFASTMIDIAMHPAYQQIIGMGHSAVPFILQRLFHEPDHWFWALKAITCEDPVPEKSRGKLDDMARAWLDWGKSKGYDFKKSTRGYFSRT
jgi:hypothetical protein